jgi:hypothetical protein
MLDSVPAAGRPHASDRDLNAHRFKYTPEPARAPVFCCDVRYRNRYRNRDRDDELARNIFDSDCDPDSDSDESSLA